MKHARPAAGYIPALPWLIFLGMLGMLAVLPGSAFAQAAALPGLTSTPGPGGSTT